MGVRPTTPNTTTDIDHRHRPPNTTTEHDHTDIEHDNPSTTTGMY
jgi:hypothetical protein